MKASKVTSLITLLLLAPSIWVFYRGASDEPYTSFHAGDAITQIGVASALIALWLLLIGYVAVQITRKNLSQVWLVTLALYALALFALYQSPAGYVSDIMHFVIAVR